ncbi:hypothetical protein [Salinibacter ruber]|uniref:hypothetical protein n=1 Tax=Salinibacter ruber TaxID=146919 RepID=UPI00216A5185|nr:hypothetical protein [Salinibacter ruber]MCS4133938.1 surface carbohydrate biosynthesis protein [Salinibacter ruber]
MKKRVLIVEQRLRRGVDANALIGAHLQRMGLDVRLSLTGSQLSSNLIRYEPHVVYYPWVTPPALRFLYKRAPEVPIVNAFQEQNAILHQPDAPMVQWADRSDYIFAWGQAHKERFEEFFERPNIMLTGNPRFDPYFDSGVAQVLYPSKDDLAEQYELPLEKDWVLFALDFPLIFQSENRIQELISRGDLKEKRLQIIREIYGNVQEWMRSLAENLPDSSVLIVRPHPGSNLEQIKRDFGGESESIRYIRGGSLPPWILATDRYLTRASTSVVEAWLADVPTALIQRKKPIEAGQARPHLVEARTSLSSYSEFRSFIIESCETDTRHRHQDFLARHYRLDGYSSLRTARRLREIANQQDESISYNDGGLENWVEHAKFFLKKVVNETGANRFNPFERPNGEFLSQREASKRVSKVEESLEGESWGE